MNKPTPKFKIFQANLDHLDLLAPLFDAYRVFYKQPPDLHRARIFVGDRIQNRESIIFMALGINGQFRDKALGFTQLFPSFSSVSTRRLWILNDLYIVEQARRLGIAEALMERARLLAEETQAKGLILETTKDNSPAQALYEKLDYKRDDDTYHYYLDI